MPSRPLRWRAHGAVEVASVAPGGRCDDRCGADRLPFTLQPLVVDTTEAVVGSMAVGGATLLGAGWFLRNRPESDDDRQVLRAIGAGVLVVVLAIVLSL